MKYNSVININDYLVPLERINDKFLSDLTFIESLSLCIHGVHCAVKSNIDEWICIWEQFQTNIHNQNVDGWPIVTCVNNYINNKFILTAVIDKQFITNKCILLNIFNIIYLEQKKLIYASAENINIINSKIRKSYNTDINVCDASLNDIFKFTYLHIKLYLKTFNLKTEYENKFGLIIIKHLS